MRIAIAGGIATGKSFVGRILRETGAIVLDADKISAKLSEDKNYISALRTVLGNDYVKCGKINKPYLKKKISEDDSLRNKLNSLSHPIIKKIINDKCESIEKEKKAVFVEIPLLITAGMSDDFDKIWYVKCSKEKRISRIIARDALDRETAENIIDAQNNELSAEDIASFVIDTTHNNIKDKVIEEYKKIIK